MLIQVRVRGSEMLTALWAAEILGAVAMSGVCQALEPNFIIFVRELCYKFAQSANTTC
jgi:hypothetical protein